MEKLFIIKKKKKIVSIYYHVSWVKWTSNVIGMHNYLYARYLATHVSFCKEIALVVF